MQYLQYVCKYLWQQHPQNSITGSYYCGAITMPIDGIYLQHHQRVMSHCTQQNAPSNNASIPTIYGYKHWLS